MRAVLDTNVLISTYVFPGGAPEAVYRLAIEGHLRIGTSLTLLAEFGRVLDQKFGWDPDRVEAAVAQVARVARVFGADVIVSGDRHLLDLGSWSDIEIIAPAEVIGRWAA